MSTSREPTRAEIDRVVSALRTHRIKVKDHVVADCAYCGRKAKLYVNTETGMHDCKHGECGEAGTLWRLATTLGIRIRDGSRGPSPQMKLAAAWMAKGKAPGSKGVPRPKVERVAHGFWDSEIPDDVAAREYLIGRGFDQDTVEHFRLHRANAFGKDGPLAIGIPFIDGEEYCPLIKLRLIDCADPSKRFMRFPAGAESPLFNRAGIANRKSVVLVEGELDAISLWQMGITNVCATSTGAKKELPASWVRDLADAEEIVLWFDNDDAGRSPVEQLTAQLGAYRCRIADVESVRELTSHGVKDANDILKLGLNGVEPEQLTAWCRKVIDNARGFESESIVRPSRYAEFLQGEIEQAEKSKGVSTGIASLDAVIGGWRTSELTLITGHTGQGKTTFAHQIVRHMADANIPVCASSFENGPESWVRKLLQTKLNHPLSWIQDQRGRDNAYLALTTIDEKPVYLMDFVGYQELPPIIDAMRWARHRLGIKYFLVDHMHSIRKGVDPRYMREHWEEVVARMFDATRELDAHIWLVAHPKGGIEKRQIPTHEDVKGSSAAKQDADNSITVWRPHDVGQSSAEARKIRLKGPDGDAVSFELSSRQSLVYVSKCRHDEGCEGAIVLDFDTRSLAYSEPKTSVAAADWSHHQESSDPLDPDFAF